MMKLLLVFGVFALVASSQAFQCYQCEYYQDDNSTDPRCNQEPVPKELLTDCSQPGYLGETWQCVKKTGKTIDEDDNEAKYVSRYCSAGAKYDNDCKESDALGSQYGTVEKGFLCYCSTDDCNGSGNIRVGTFAAIFSFIVIAFRYQN